MIDRYLLRYFLAVVDNGSFSRAAAQCNVSQPTLSVGVAKLEKSLGAPLFLRSNQRVELTDAGSRFLGHARRIEDEFNMALKAMSGAQAVPLLRVGILRSVPSKILAEAVAALPAEDRGSGLELVEGSERELIGHVARGRLDIALTLVDRGGDRFLEEPLLEEGYALALPASHPLADRETIAGEALADNVMIVRRHCEALSETSRHFTERGVRPHFALRSTDDDRVLHMVAAGLGVTVMPDSFCHPGVARPRLTGFGARRTIGLIYGARAEGSRDMPSPFIMALRTVFRSQEAMLRAHNS